MINAQKFTRPGAKTLTSSEERRKRRFNENLKSQKLSRTKSWFSRRMKSSEPEPEPEPMDAIDSIINEIDMMDVNNNSSVLHTSIQQSWITDLQDSSVQRQWTVLNKLVKLISATPHPTLDDLVKLRLVGLFVNMLKTQFPPRNQSNIAYIISKISDLQTSIHDQLPADTIDIVANVLKQTFHTQTKVELMGFLGNICNREQTQIAILESECWTQILELMQKFDCKSNSKEIRELFENATYCLKRCCTSLQNLPNINRPLMALPIVAKLLREADFRYTLIHCLHILASFTFYSNKLVLDLGINDKLADFLQISKHGEGVANAAMKVIGNILFGSNTEAQQLIDAGVVPLLHKIMFYDKKDRVKARACWCISNICCGSQKQLEVLLVDNLYQDMLQQFVSGSEDVQYELAHGFNCSLSRKRTSKEQLQMMLSLDVIGVLCDALTTIKDLETLVVVIGTLRRLVRIDIDILRQVRKRIGE